MSRLFLLTLFYINIVITQPFGFCVYYTLFNVVVYIEGEKSGNFIDDLPAVIDEFDSTKERKLEFSL